MYDVRSTFSMVYAGTWLNQNIIILILGFPDQVEEQPEEADEIEPDQGVDQGLVVQEEGVLGTRASDPWILVGSGPIS